MFAFFSVTGGILPPHRQPATAGRDLPTRIFVNIMFSVVCPTAIATIRKFRSVTLISYLRWTSASYRRRQTSGEGP